MKIEDKIRNERSVFDDKTLPEGHRERFMKTLVSYQMVENKRDESNKRRTWLLTLNVLAAACLAIAIIISNVNLKITDKMPSQSAENTLHEMRKIYDDKVYEAVSNLETVTFEENPKFKKVVNPTVISNKWFIGNIDNIFTSP